ncbi:Gfo/Idh/MocA family protein [Lewinella sp. IMCC34183]|uniref:Gfo/Idh/MocA family protein n=1 Tax=Lewinella sp. IMCC34183 TaxID=2248762 RepID=UPI000E289E7F|nr:Gfo/Idh/MocA family oxidoreductase [Lewinella sp. IMCC34183]
MPHPSPLRIALIGLGDIAQKAYLPLVASHPGISPLLCTRDPAVLERLGRQYRIADRFTELDALIAHRPDAAMIHSSTDSHAAIATRLLEAGIPVFVDKPLTADLATTEQILALAQRQNLPVFLGFNRRYAPLVSALREEADPIQVTWHKNRAALPGEPRDFVFVDFIHVLDGLRFLAPGPVTDLHVHARRRGGLLESVQVRWTCGDCLLTGGMNRVNGVTEETVDYFTPGNKWTIRELHDGIRYRDGSQSPLGFGNWAPTLEKRGFAAMVDDWFATVRKGGYDAAYADDVRATHALCEEVVAAIGA